MNVRLQQTIHDELRGRSLFGVRRLRRFATLCLRQKSARFPMIFRSPSNYVGIDGLHIS